MVHPRNSMRSSCQKALSKRTIYLKLFKNCELLVIFVIWMSLGLLAGPALAHETQVYGGTGCIDGGQLEQRIDDLLTQYAPDRADTQNLTARMAVSLSAENLWVSIKLTDASGRIALARRYQLHKNDCPDVPDLLSLVLREFLREFPENPWQDPQESRRPSSEAGQSSSVQLRLGIALLGEVQPGGAKVETNANLHGPIEQNFRWQTGLKLRANLPKDVLEGSYQQLEFLFGAGLAIEFWQTVWDIQVLGGGYILTGQYFSENRVAIAPAFEVSLGTRWYWKSLSLGPTLNLSLLQHQVQVLPENNQYPISILNIGLTIQYDTI